MDAPRMSAWDVTAFAALAVFMTAALLPWHSYQPCPIFQECGETVIRSGWQEAPWLFAIAGVGAIVGYVLVPHAVGRRLIVAAGGVLALLPLPGIDFGIDFRVFANTEGPFVGFWVAAIAGVAWFSAGLVAASRELEPAAHAQTP